MIELADYLRLLPKAELHCHYVAVMRPERLVRLARKNGVALRSERVDDLLDYDNLVDFLDVFNAAHEVLAEPDDFATVAYEGVQDGVALGNLRYREYYVNPGNFAPRGIGYASLVDSIAEGLRQAETDYGVGFRLVIAINRSHSPADAVALVEQVIENARDFVVGIGMDDLTGRHGLKRTAHAGETMTGPPRNVVDAIQTLQVDRIDHGYRVVDDPDSLRIAKDSGVPFTCTPFSTRMLSAWQLTPEHRIATMIREGLPLSLATDDAVFFRTDIGREYSEALPAMGFGAEDATRIARTSFEMSWCDDSAKAAYLAQAEAQFRALDAVLVPSPEA